MKIEFTIEELEVIYQVIIKKKNEDIERMINVSKIDKEICNKIAAILVARV